MSVEQTLYQYQPLASSKCIRVVQLLPATSKKDHLRCHVVQLDRNELWLSPDNNASRYQAVSYVWGESVFPASVFVLDKEEMYHIPITGAVDVMLRQFRHHAKKINLWVDAICLDQKNEAEVAQQVVMMGDIYREARKVRIWLGPASEDDELEKVFAFFRRLAFDKSDMTRAAAMDLQDRILKMRPDALQRFLHRPWFTRRWVLQELALARTAVIFAGDQTISYPELYDGIRVLQQLVLSEDDLAVSLRLDTRSERAVEILEGLKNPKYTLLDRLWRYHDIECKDPRDKFFALAGLCSSEVQMAGDQAYLGNNLLSYQSGFEDLFEKIAQHYIDRGLLLEVIRHSLAFGNLADKPSWCPNWSNRRAYESRSHSDLTKLSSPDVFEKSKHNESVKTEKQGEFYPPYPHVFGPSYKTLFTKQCGLVVERCVEIPSGLADRLECVSRLNRLLLDIHESEMNAAIGAIFDLWLSSSTNGLAALETKQSKDDRKEDFRKITSSVLNELKNPQRARGLLGEPEADIFDMVMETFAGQNLFMTRRTEGVPEFKYTIGPSHSRLGLCKQRIVVGDMILIEAHLLRHRSHSGFRAFEWPSDIERVYVKPSLSLQTITGSTNSGVTEQDLSLSAEQLLEMQKQDWNWNWDDAKCCQLSGTVKIAMAEWIENHIREDDGIPEWNLIIR